MVNSDPEQSGWSVPQDSAADPGAQSAAAFDAAALAGSDLTARIGELERRLAGSPGAGSKGQAWDLIRLQRSIGELRWERYRRSGDAADIERAWLTLTGALQTWTDAELPPTADPEMFAALCYDVAIILRLQAVSPSPGNALDEAVATLELAVAAAPGTARYRAELALALLDSAELSGDKEQFDRTIELFRELVPPPADPGSDPDARASAQCDLADAQVRKFLRAMATDDILVQVMAYSDLDQAIDVLDEAAATVGLTSLSRARVARAYAFAVSSCCTRDRMLYSELSPAVGQQPPVVTSGKLGRAEELLRDLMREGEQAGDTAQLLVDLLLRDWEVCARPEALTEAQAVARAAVAATAPASYAGDSSAEAAAGAQLALGRVLAACPMDASGPDLAEPTMAAFRAACDGYQRLGLLQVVDAAEQWARCAVTLARWPDAAEAFSRVEAGVQAGIGALPRQQDRLVLLRTMTGVATDAAFARALAGNPAAAIEELEFDRNMFYAAVLTGGASRDAGRSGAAAAWLRAGQAHAAGLRVDIEDLTARFPDTALVFLVPASVGGLALIAAPGEPPQVELLPELTAAATEPKIGRFWGALLARQHRPTGNPYMVIGDDGVEDLTPQAQLDALTGWLWTAAMRRVVQLAGRWPRIALIPTGMLVSAPLHAAWRPDAKAFTGRRYAIDDAQIVYLPTASLVRPSTPDPLTDLTRLLVVQDPRPCSAPELPGAAAEAAVVARSFSDVTSLAKDEATREHVLAALPKHDIAHLICHGRGDPVNPIDSHLVLSNDEHLSVADLLDRDLSTLRLAVLSACESASPSTHLPEAAINLPAALVAVGASGVVGSLWEAADADTSVLMARFYGGLRTTESGCTPAEPAEALRAAQRWMRDTTNAQKAEALPDLIDSGRDRGGPRLTALWAQARTSSLHWAGFIYAGR
jgi:hypothetical protein